DRVSALAVQRVTWGDGLLRRGHHIAAETGGMPCGLTAENGRGDADSELEADHVVRPVQRSVTTAVIGVEPVFGEALDRVVGARLEADEDAPPQVMVDLGAVTVH